MRYRWSYSEDGGTAWTEVTPTNGSRLSITQARDLNAGQVFFRKKLAQAVVLGGADFRLLDAIRRNPARRCATLLLRCEKMCGQWGEYWRGEFSAGSCKWDLDLCTVEVKADTVDRYSCLLGKKDVKRNILNADVVNVNVLVLPPGLEILATEGWTGLLPPPADYGWVEVDTQSIVYPPGMGFCSGDPATLRIFWRETVTTDCVGGLPVAPAGTGWQQLFPGEPFFEPEATDCATSNQTKWARIPAATWPFPNDPIVLGPVDLPFDEPTSPSCNSWYRIGQLTCLGAHAVGMFICLEDAVVQTSIDRARTLVSAVDYIIDKAECDTLGARSDFFEWDPPGDAPGYVAGENYVTGTENQVDQLLILQKTDVIAPTASNPATIGEMTFTEMMTALRVMFRVYWDIDDAGNVRIEHWSYWVFAVGLDLVTAERPNEPLVYESLGEEIPRVERARWMEALGLDFVGKDIIYDSPCVPDGAAENVKEWNPGRITTDVAYVISDPTAISRDGFVVLATNFNGVDYDCIVDTGALSNSPATNAPLSWANLERDFWTYDRYLPAANMNGTDTVFDAFLPNVKQEEVSIAMCCDALTFDPKKRVDGELARLLGTTAYVESASLDLFTQRLKLVLRYAY